jgi:hypothetical protein
VHILKEKNNFDNLGKTDINLIKDKKEKEDQDKNMVLEEEEILMNLKKLKILR